MDVKIEAGWHQALQAEFEKPYFAELTQFVRSAYRQGQVFPPSGLIFNAFDSCPFQQVKVVILGQDPYHDVGQAHGLSFSVRDGIPFPPSLRNIFTEISQEYGTPMPTSGNLERWAQQGVLLLNATLTVEAHKAGSHQGHGWERFTDAAILALASQREHIVFMLWGSYAQQKRVYIDPQRHCLLMSAHPSPLSAYRGFFGCNHFHLANDYLRQHGLSEIIW